MGDGEMKKVKATKIRDFPDLPTNDANYTALSPLWFLERAATVYPTRTSLVYGDLRYTWIETYRRCRRLASALSNQRIGSGDIVAVIAPNIPAMYEAHFGIPMTGAVINAINIRLNASTIAFLLDHSKSKVLMVDQQFFSMAYEALKLMSENTSYKLQMIIVIADKNCDSDQLTYALEKGAVEYETFLKAGDPEFPWQPPMDEWQSIGLGYTSGTTSSPKGVVLSHRGAYLVSLNNVLNWGVQEGAVYLWTLPMFHCNGWGFTWTLAAVSGTNICLRQVRVQDIFSAISNEGVTHFCAAPVVLNSIINAPKNDLHLPLPRLVNVMTGGVAPSQSLLLSMADMGFEVTHSYGLSETFGPSVICAWKPEWNSLPPSTQASLKARQGVRYIGLECLDVIDIKTGKPVPADGRTMGEVVMRGNIVMKGYLKNPQANSEAFANGWFHSGDLAVKHPDRYIQLKDRSKDIIISGGENISSLEVENIMSSHPAILEVSVVAKPDEQWGESPCAFVTLKTEMGSFDEGKVRDDIVEFCKGKMPAFWVPKSLIFGRLPKTATGKVQKHLLRIRAKL